MAQQLAPSRWRTVAAPAFLCALGLVTHLSSPALGWGAIGSIGGGMLAVVGALMLMGVLHGRRLSCPACGAPLPFGPRDGYEHRLVTCRACHAHLHVGTDGLSVMPERVVSGSSLEPRHEMARH